MRQRDDDLTVRRERTSQSPDRAAEFDQPRQVVGDALRDVGHDLRVQLLELALDSLEGAEVAGDDPLDNRCGKRRRVERTDLTSPFGALAELLEHFYLCLMSCHDPVGAEHAFDGAEDRFTPLAAGDVQRHVQVLACVHQGGATRLLEQSLCLLVAELERLLHGRDLVLVRVAQCEPEQRIVGEPVECGRQVLLAPGLSFVEHEEREHLPWVPETAAFPCPIGGLPEPVLPTGREWRGQLNAAPPPANLPRSYAVAFAPTSASRLPMVCIFLRAVFSSSRFLLSNFATSSSPIASAIVTRPS